MNPMVTVSKECQVPKGQVQEWYFLALKYLWKRYVPAREHAHVSTSKIQFLCAARTEMKTEVCVSVVIDLVGDQKQLVHLSPTKPPRRPNPFPTLPRPARKGRPQVGCDVGFGLNSPETDPVRVQCLLENMAAVFAEAAAEIATGVRSNYVIGILFQAGRNWPSGVTVFEPYQMFSVGEPLPFEGSYAFLLRTVTGTSRDDCEVKWNQRLVSAVTMLGVLTGQPVRLCRRIPAAVTQHIKVTSNPIIELLDRSHLLPFAQSLRPIKLTSAYGEKSLSLHCLPDDLHEMFAVYERFPTKHRDIVDDALTAYQVGIEQKESMPTIALTAFWTALERLVDWDKNIKKTGEPCRQCKIARPRSGDAVLELLRSLIQIDDKQAKAVARTLSDIRKYIRNPWAHRGSLAGLDFVDQPEVWVATTETEVPAWARTEQLLGEAGDYIRQIVVRILEQAKNGEC